MAKLSIQPYKGTRDLYPEDMRVQRYIFDTWSHVAARYGYQEIDGPMLELTDLYRAKTGEEIVNEQLYRFEDRGGRDVAMRPEFTPTVSRMVAARSQELPFPWRVFSIPNLWRYERPQRGRLREHWQLNVDIFGMDDLAADFELIMCANDIMKEFGAKAEMYDIRINSRRLLAKIMGSYLGLGVDDSHALGKLLDKKAKITPESFEDQARVIVHDNYDKLTALLDAKTMADLPEELKKDGSVAEIKELFKLLHEHEITNARFDITLMRGFDYYTDVVFEVFDKHPDNNRSMFGGGRYDGLVSLFGGQGVPAAGFGMGDVTIGDFLHSHELLPELKTSEQVRVITIDEVGRAKALQLAAQLRSAGVNTGTDTTDRKAGVQLKAALKAGVAFALFVGEKDVAANKYPLKDLAAGSEDLLEPEAIVKRLQK